MRTAGKILSVLLAIFFIWNIFIYITNKNTVIYVTYGSIKDAISCEAQIIKDEVLVQAPADGALQPYLTDCEKAGKGNSVAAILSGETNEGARKKLTFLKSRITSLEDVLKNKGFEDDVVSVDNAVTEDIGRIISAGSSGRYHKIYQYKENIIKQLDRRSSAENGDGAQILAGLKNEQKELEASLGNLINEVYAPVSGVFSARLDGLEGKYSSETIDKLTRKDLEIIKNTKSSKADTVSKGENVCKIINNFEWYLATLLKKEQLGELEEGDGVNISFRDADGETTRAYIVKIIEEGGMYITVFKVNKDINGILSRRSASIDIIKNQYSGLKVPTGALVFENDKTGVYVVEGSEKFFKEVDVIFHNENYAVVKEEVSTEEAPKLKLYDNVEVNGDVK